MTALSHKLNEEARQIAFENLADSQRGDPELAMVAIQRTQIAQAFGWVCEHVGDLTHRMSENFKGFKGQYDIVSNKVEKTLRELKHPRFEENITIQAESNFKYAKNENIKWHDSVESSLEKLKKLALEYAYEHSKLKVYNYVQWLAREAAVHLGKMEFSQCIEKLSKLDSILSKGEKTWIKKSGEYNPDY